MRFRLVSHIRGGMAALLAVLTLSAAPVAAVTVPSVTENGWGHLFGCLSVFLDRPVHAEFCGPSEITQEMLDEMMKHNAAPPPPPPSCVPCSGGALWDGAFVERSLVASLYNRPGPLIAKDDEPVILLACCPGGSP